MAEHPLEADAKPQQHEQRLRASRVVHATRVRLPVGVARHHVVPLPLDVVAELGLELGALGRRHQPQHHGMGRSPREVALAGADVLDDDVVEELEQPHEVEHHEVDVRDLHALVVVLVEHALLDRREGQRPDDVDRKVARAGDDCAHVAAALVVLGPRGLRAEDGQEGERHASNLVPGDRHVVVVVGAMQQYGDDSAAPSEADLDQDIRNDGAAALEDDPRERVEEGAHARVLASVSDRALMVQLRHLWVGLPRIDEAVRLADRPFAS